MASSKSKSDSLNGLTPIHQRIHCAATTDSGGDNNELEQMQVDHFLQTLAGIALAVAARRPASDGGGLA